MAGVMAHIREATAWGKFKLGFYAIPIIITSTIGFKSALEHVNRNEILPPVVSDTLDSTLGNMGRSNSQQNQARTEDDSAVLCYETEQPEQAEKPDYSDWAVASLLGFGFTSACVRQGFRLLRDSCERRFIPDMPRDYPASRFY